jgi:hypothetical protein
VLSFLYKKPNKLNDKMVKEIYEKYYLSELKSLEVLTGLDLSSWSK